MFLATCLSLNSGDLDLFFFEIWWIWVFFLHEKFYVYRLKSYYSGQNLMEIHQ
jgi:hypothetical protein